MLSKINGISLSGAWIITGGTHAGVMKHVGEAVKDFDIASSAQNPVVTIGIAPWGCVQNRHALINKEVCRRRFLSSPLVLSQT